MQDGPRNDLVFFGVGIKVAFFPFFFEMFSQEIFCQYNVDMLMGIGIDGFHQHIIDVGAHGESEVRRQGPRCGGPGQEETVLTTRLLEEKFRSFVADGLKHGYHRGVFHILVGAGLIELVGAESGTGCG